MFGGGKKIIKFDTQEGEQQQEVEQIKDFESTHSPSVLIYISFFFFLDHACVREYIHVFGWLTGQWVLPPLPPTIISNFFFQKSMQCHSSSSCDVVSNVSISVPFVLSVHKIRTICVATTTAMTMATTMAICGPICDHFHPLLIPRPPYFPLWFPFLGRV